MIQNRAEIKQTFGAVALFVNRNHLVSSGTFYTYYTHARVCEKNMQCTYCPFCPRRAVHYFFLWRIALTWLTSEKYPPAFTSQSHPIR